MDTLEEQRRIARKMLLRKMRNFKFMTISSYVWKYPFNIAGLWFTVAN
jgi:hypothetical protein